MGAIAAAAAPAAAAAAAAAAANDANDANDANAPALGAPAAEGGADVACVVLARMRVLRYVPPAVLLVRTRVVGVP